LGGGTASGDQGGFRNGKKGWFDIIQDSPGKAIDAIRGPKNVVATLERGLGRGTKGQEGAAFRAKP